MECVCCGSAAVTERPERTAQGYRRFRCRDCGKQFNERSAGLLNRTQYPSDIIALVVLWWLRYRLTLRDLCEMFLLRGIVFRWVDGPQRHRCAKMRSSEPAAREPPAMSISMIGIDTAKSAFQLH